MLNPLQLCRFSFPIQELLPVDSELVNRMRTKFICCLVTILSFGPKAVAQNQEDPPSPTAAWADTHGDWTDGIIHQFADTATSELSSETSATIVRLSDAPQADPFEFPPIVGPGTEAARSPENSSTDPEIMGWPPSDAAPIANPSITSCVQNASPPYDSAFTQNLYCQQCPGFQSLTALERLHIKASFADRNQKQGCPPTPSFQSGDYTALVITRFVDKELIKSWLPEGLILDSNCPFQDCHPVIILCGEQRDFARTRDKTQYPLWGRNYNEVFMSIPYLKLKKSPEKPPVHHFFKVYVDNWPATYLGIENGWPKIHVPIKSKGNCYSIFHCDYGMIFNANTDYACAQPITPSGEASFQAIREMLEMPMVLQKPTGSGFKVVDFDLHFECAQVRSVPSEICIRCGFLPGLSPTQEFVPGINEASYGAFLLQAHFTAKKKKY